MPGHFSRRNGGNMMAAASFSAMLLRIYSGVLKASVSSAYALLFFL